MVIFSLLLKFAWENLQAPLFDGMAAAPHWPAVKFCGMATLGDAAIVLFAFWSVAAAARDRRWILSPSPWQVTGFVTLGLVVTAVVERLATGPMERWAYAPAMPVLPWLGLGLAPMLQWLVVPPLVLWFSRRHIAAPP